MATRFVWQPDEATLADTTLSAFLRGAGLGDLAALHARAAEEPEWYWSALLDFFGVRFPLPYETMLDLSRGIAWPRWCAGGTTSLVLNCLDRHRDTPTWARPAIVWEGETGAVRSWTYAKLADETSRLAGALAALGVGAGDVVALYMPMLPETAAAFLAVAKIGAIAMPLFSGFGPEPLRARLAAAGAKAVITADGAFRRGALAALKPSIDEAAEGLETLAIAIVLRHAGNAVAMKRGRDLWWHEAVEAPEIETAVVDAEAPAMLMYTSGTTGAAKGTVHTHCGMLGKNALDLGLCIDLKAHDRLLWMSDMGWIVGPKAVVSATLLGATLVMAEGAPDFPDPGRLWRLVEEHRVSILGVAPTAVRQMMGAGAAGRGRDLSSLRAVVSSGEAWTEDAWLWLFDTVLERRTPILNYAGGTECGGAILIGSFHRPLKPCAFGGPVPGMGADIVDRGGRSLPPGEVGELVLRAPSIGLSRGLWREPERYESYWRRIPGVWVQGDLAIRDRDGLWYLQGRSDDTIKIAGRRTGPAEIESLVVASGLVAEAAVVGVPDPTTGSALVCVCVPAEQGADAEALIADLVATRFGRPYRPKAVLFVSQLPKTRNHKIMRRLVRAALSGAPLGDLSALANPEALHDLEALTSQRGSP